MTATETETETESEIQRTRPGTDADGVRARWLAWAGLEASFRAWRAKVNRTVDSAFALPVRCQARFFEIQGRFRIEAIGPSKNQSQARANLRHFLPALYSRRRRNPARALALRAKRVDASSEGA